MHHGLRVRLELMNKINKHIEILRSSKPELSSMSQKSCDAIYDILVSHFEVVGISVVDNLSDLKRLVSKRPDLVFMGMKYLPGTLPDSKIWVSGYLDQHNINHTGSGKGAIELEQNKSLAKQCVLDAGIQTSPFLVIKNGDTYSGTNMPLQFPLFVKPTSLGAGQGVDINSVVHDMPGLRAKTKSLSAEFSSDSLVEEYLPGREFTVAILKDGDSEELVAMPLEMMAGRDINGDRIISYELKSAPLETPVFPVTDERLKAMVSDLATRVFVSLGARDYGRVDIRLDINGNAHFLEANLIPGLICGSGNFPKACAINAGIDHKTMILNITKLGLARSKQELVAA